MHNTEEMQIAIIGSSEENRDAVLQSAYEVGALLAQKDVKIVCGGLTGVMSEVSRGAFEKGGDVIAILPGLDPAESNPWATHIVATGTSHARNLAVVASADSVIAIGGSWGTLSEIAFASRLEVGVVCLGEWRIDFPSQEKAELLFANDSLEAVELAMREAVLRNK